MAVGGLAHRLFSLLNDFSLCVALSLFLLKFNPCRCRTVSSRELPRDYRWPHFLCHLRTSHYSACLNERWRRCITLLLYNVSCVYSTSYGIRHRTSAVLLMMKTHRTLLVFDCHRYTVSLSDLTVRCALIGTTFSSIFRRYGFFGEDTSSVAFVIFSDVSFAHDLPDYCLHGLIV